MRIAVLGLGEAGTIYARGLAERGADVVAFDKTVIAAGEIEIAEHAGGRLRAYFGGAENRHA